jgi:hypothetical protein
MSVSPGFARGALHWLAQYQATERKEDMLQVLHEQEAGNK